MAASRRLRSAAELDAALRDAASRLAVAAFTASWSAPCEAVPALLTQLSAMFPDVVFLEVDIDQCRTLATTHGVALPNPSSSPSSSSSSSPPSPSDATAAAAAVSLPAFVFFRHRVRLDSATLVAPHTTIESLSRKIRRLVGHTEEHEQAVAAATVATATEAVTAAAVAAATVAAATEAVTAAVATEADSSDIPRGYVELNALVNQAGCECLNGSDDHGLENSLARDDSFLESDCDEQLLISMAFNQPVRLYALRIIGPGDGHAPRSLKIFINQTRSMDFDEAERCEATQSLQLSPEELTDESSIQLRYVKFQHVNNVTVFVKDNQGGEDTTRICYLSFIGTTVQATNMGDFKRIAGKKGESH